MTLIIEIAIFFLVVICPIALVAWAFGDPESFFRAFFKVGSALGRRFARMVEAWQNKDKAPEKKEPKKELPKDETK